MWTGNLVGAVAFAAAASLVGPGLGIIDPAAFGQISESLTAHTWWVILFSAVFAGWLMGLLTWLVEAARETISQLVVIIVTTGAIGLAGLHHSIAGAVEVLLGVFRSAATPGEFGVFLLWTTLGNAVGGSVFVALLKYAHAVRSEPEPDEV